MPRKLSPYQMQLHWCRQRRWAVDVHFVEVRLAVQVEQAPLLCGAGLQRWLQLSEITRTVPEPRYVPAQPNLKPAHGQESLAVQQNGAHQLGDLKWTAGTLEMHSRLHSRVLCCGCFPTMLAP
jgi:hypothetical protein